MNPEVLIVALEAENAALRETIEQMEALRGEYGRIQVECRRLSAVIWELRDKANAFRSPPWIAICRMRYRNHRPRTLRVVIPPENVV